MQRYTDTVLLTSHGALHPMPYASVTVYVADTLDKATLYSDDGTTTTDNPLTADAEGKFSFYATDGLYDIVATVGGRSETTYAVPIWDRGVAGASPGQDITVALQAKVDAVGARGGGKVELGPGTFYLSDTITVNYSNIEIIGAGGDQYHNAGTNGAKAATKLVWSGADGGTMVHFTSVEGTSAQKMSGGGIRDVWLSSGVTTNGTGASYGVRISSRDQTYVDRVFVWEPQVAGLLMDCVTQLGDPRDPQHCRITNLWTRNFINETGGLIRMYGDVSDPPGTGATGTPANVSLNHFENLGCQFRHGNALHLFDCDHNYFINCRAFRFSGGTGSAIVFEGSDSGESYTARYNVFIGWTGGNVIEAKGTDTYTYASFGNVFIMLDAGNNTAADITRETDATCFIHSKTDGYYYGITSARAGLFAQSLNQLVSGTAGIAGLSTESLRVVNAASNQMRLVTSDAFGDVAHEWGISIDGATGYLRLVNLGADGILNISDTQLISQEQVISDNASTVLDELANRTNETLRIRNTASNHIRLTNGTEEWGLNIDGATGDFRINRLAGTGIVRLPTASTAASVPANFTASRYYAIQDSSGTTYYIPLSTTTF